MWHGQRVEDTNGLGDATGTDRLDAAGLLRHEYQELFPHQQPDRSPGGARWKAAAANGATLQWALRTAGTTAGEVTADTYTASWVGGALRLAVEVPVTVIDELLVDGWHLTEIYYLLERTNGRRFIIGGFAETVRRLRMLHQTAPETGEPDGRSLWQALAAVIFADPAGLTDLQALRWVQVLAPGSVLRTVLTTGLQALAPSGLEFFTPRVAMSIVFVDDNTKVLQEWVASAGPDGWAWPAAGYTPEQARLLLALPKTDPDRPGPDQLKVMAALRQT